MNNVKFISAEDITIKINGNMIGMVRSFEVESKINCRYIYKMLETDVAAEPSTEEHKIKMKKLRLYSDSGALCDLYSIKDFSLTVVLPQYSLNFEKCYFSSIKESCDINGQLIEEAVITAQERTKE